MKIKYTNWGIAYTTKDCIEINPILLKHPKYLKQVIAHELEHCKSPKTNMDFMLDFKESFTPNWEATKFSIQHPLICLQSICPVWIDKKGINYNLFTITLFLSLSMLLIIGGLII